MATRFYLRTSGSPPVSPTYGGGATWNNTGAASRGIMDVVKGGTTHTDYTVSADATTGNRTHLVRQFVSPKLAAQTFSGTVKAQIRGLESATGFNGKIAINVYRVNSSGTYQDTLLTITYSDSDTSPYELATSATNRRVYNSSESQPISLTSRTFSAGDYLVVEIGIAENGTTTSRTGTLRFGDNNATDLGDNTTDTSDYCPYVEFSADIVLQERLTGTIGATSSCSGELSVTKDITGTIDGISTVGAELGRIRQIESIISAKNKVPRNQATGTDFNADLTGIDNLGSTLTSDTSEYHTGSRSMKAVCTTNGQGAISDTNNYIPISASTQMTVSGWAKAVTQNWYIGIIQYDSNKSQINMEFQWVGSNAAWTRGSHTFTSASNGAYARVFQSSDGAGTFYFDDVQLENGTLTDWEEPITGGIVGISTVTGELSTGSTISLDGSITATSSVSGDLGRLVSLYGFVYKNNKLIPNQATGTDTLGDTTGFYPNNDGVTISSSTDYALSGSRSLKIVSDGRAGGMGLGTTWDVLVNVLPYCNYTFSMSAMSSADWTLGLGFFDSGYGYLGQTSQTITADAGNWKRGSVNFNTPANCAYLVWWVQIPGATALTWYIDNLMIEDGTLSDWIEKIPVISTVSGILSNLIDISGTISAQSNLPDAELTITGFTYIPLDGTVTGTSDVPNSSLLVARDIIGSITGESSVSGILNYNASLDGIIQGISTLNGLLNVDKLITGSVTGISSIDGILNYTASLSGSIDSQSTISADILGNLRQITGSITVISNLPDSELTITSLRLLDGSISCQSTINGNLGVTYSINGTVTGQSNLPDTELYRLRSINGLITGSSNLPTSNLGVIYGLSGSITGLSLLDANINLIKDITGSISAQSNIVTTDINRIRTIYGSIDIISGIPDTELNLITVFTELTGSINIWSDVSASELNRIVGLLGSINITSHTYGTLIKYLRTYVTTDNPWVDIYLRAPVLDLSIFTTKIDMELKAPNIDINMKCPRIYFEIQSEDEIL